MTRFISTVVVIGLATAALSAQGPAPKDPPKPPSGLTTSTGLKELVRADLSLAEAGTPEALTASLYAFISGPAGQKRDIERIRALFHLSCRIVMAGKHPQTGPFFRPADLEAFLGWAIPQWEKTGILEQGGTPSVQRWEGMAQVWSPYTLRSAADGPVTFRGVNALQCAFDGKRWWITHLQFQNLPAEAPADPGKKN